MTDLKKRTTLKTLSAASAIAAAPAIASAACRNTQHVTDGTPHNGLHLTFDRSATSDMQVVTVNNASYDAATLKHVSPGLVKSGDHVFDVNDLLVNGPVTVNPGETRTFTIKPVALGAGERRAPTGTIGDRPLSVSTYYKSLTGSKSVTTQRLCLA